MVELTILGSVALRGPHGHDHGAVLAQPKRLALLAYLAIARRDTFARRDELVALFWPECDDMHARGALRQATRFLRRALGDAVLMNRGAEEIGIDRRELSCDAVAMDEAYDAGMLTVAADLYRGDLLRGLHVVDASAELERWIEDERGRLRRRARQAEWQLVARHEAEGNLSLAADRARRASGMDPYDEDGLKRLMMLLARTGERDEATRAYQTFARRLAADLDVAPAAETTAMLATVRALRAKLPGAAHAAAAARAPTVAPDASAQVQPIERDLPRRPRWTWLASALVVALGVFAAGTTVRVGARTTPGHSSAPPVLARSPGAQQAHDLYLKADFLFHQGTVTTMRRAVDYAEASIRADSGFAPAYGLLAIINVHLPMYGEVAPNDAFPRAQAAALRALELDRSSGDATLALAQVTAYFHWEWLEADRLFRRAIDLDPESSRTRVAYADYLSSAGRLTESLAQYARAKALDPSSPRALNNYARRLMWAGDYEGARIQLDSALTLQPNFARAHRTLGILYLGTRRYRDAIRELSQARDLGGGRPFDLSALAQAYILAGEHGAAMQVLRGLEARAEQEYVPPYAIATVYASLGRSDEAFRWLDRALDAHDATMSHTVLYETMLDPIRGDPRFADVLRRMRLGGGRA